MTTGLRKIIYIPNEEIWQGIQASAKMDGRSVSNYLVTLHQVSAQARDTKQSDQGFIDEPGSISEEVYKNIEIGNKPAQPDKFESHRSIAPIAKKRVKNVVEEIPGVQSASNIFNPQPKGKK